MGKALPLWVKILIILWIVISIIFAVPGYIQDSKLPTKTYGSPKIITEPLSFDTARISQIIDDGTYIYVMANCHQGYMQVYDLSGTYKKTVSFFNPSLNGVFAMEIDSDMLYVQDPDQNIYVFCAGDFIQFISKSNVPQHIKEKRFKENSAHYKIRLGSVWRIDGQEETCVIQRSWKAIVYQYHLNWIFIFTYVLIIGSHVLKRSENEQRQHL